MTTNISLINFHSQTLMAIEHEGQKYVAMRNIVENLGLAWVGQYIKLKNHPVLSKGVMIIITPSHGGLQETVCLPLKMLNGWLLTIDPRKVRPEIRARLLQYQEECYEVLYQYFSNQRQIPAQQSSEARQRHIRLKLLDLLKKETDPIVRGTLIAELDDLTQKLGLPSAEFAKIGHEAPPQPERVSEFWEAFEFVQSQGELLNHSHEPHCLAINIPQVRMAFEKHQQNFNFAGIHSLLRLSKDPKYEDYKTVSSIHEKKTLKCWVFSDAHAK